MRRPQAEQTDLKEADEPECARIRAFSQSLIALEAQASMATDEDRVGVTTSRESGRTRVRIVFPVQTETGRRATSAARAVRAIFVQTVTIERGGTPVFVAYLGPSMARTPELSFDLANAGPGDQLNVIWTDNNERNYKQSFTLK